MTMQRRSFLTLSAAGAAGAGLSLLGTGQAGAVARAASRRAMPVSRQRTTARTQSISHRASPAPG